MQGIISFLKGIGNIIVSLVDFVISFFQDIIYLIQLLGKFLLELPRYFSWMPPQFSALLLVLFSLVVLYKILGREG